MGTLAPNKSGSVCPFFPPYPQLQQVLKREVLKSQHVAEPLPLRQEIEISGSTGIGGIGAIGDVNSTARQTPCQNTVGIAPSQLVVFHRFAAVRQTVVHFRSTLQVSRLFLLNSYLTCIQSSRVFLIQGFFINRVFLINEKYLISENQLNVKHLEGGVGPWPACAS